MENNLQEHYPSGKLMFTVPSKNGVEHGPSKHFYETGELMYEGNWVNGEQQGVFKLYYKNGDLKRENTFKNHNKIYQKEYYKGNKIQFEGKYDEFENKTGKWCYYYENGNLKKEELFNKNVSESIKEWDEEGNLKLEEKLTEHDTKNNTFMEITKESIISSILGISSNITIEDFCKHLYQGNEKIQDLINGEWIDFCSGGGSLSQDSNNNLSFDFECSEDDGVTFILEKIFGEKYLLRIDEVMFYGDDGEYIEIRIYDQNEPILENVINIDKSELSLEEKKIYDEQREEHDMYLDRYEGISLIKKSEFNKDNIEGQSI